MSGEKRKREEEEKVKERETKVTQAKKKRKKEEKAPEYILSEEEKELAEKFKEWREERAKEGERKQENSFLETFVHFEKECERLLPLSSLPSLSPSSSSSSSSSSSPFLPEMVEGEGGESSVGHVAGQEETEKEFQLLKEKILSVFPDMRTARLGMRLTIPSHSEAQNFSVSVQKIVLKEMERITRFCGFSFHGIGYFSRNRAALLELVCKRGWNEDYTHALKCVDETGHTYVRQWNGDFRTLYLLIDNVIKKNLGSKNSGKMMERKVAGRSGGMAERARKIPSTTRRYSSNFS